MPGVFRPSTLTDVLSVIQQQAIGNTDTSVSGVGAFAETADVMTAADSVTGTVQANPDWGAATWGTAIWG